MKHIVSLNSLLPRLASFSILSFSSPRSIWPWWWPRDSTEAPGDIEDPQHHVEMLKFLKNEVNP